MQKPQEQERLIDYLQILTKVQQSCPGAQLSCPQEQQDGEPNDGQDLEPFDEWWLVDEALTDPTIARARAYLHERNVSNSLNMDVDAVLEKYVPASAGQTKKQCNSRLQFEDMILHLPHNFEARIEKTELKDSVDMEAQMKGTMAANEAERTAKQAKHRADRLKQTRKEKKEKDNDRQGSQPTNQTTRLEKEKTRKKTRSHTDVQTAPVPDSSTVVYFFNNRSVSDMGIAGRLKAFEWSCCAYKLFAEAQACCKKATSGQQTERQRLGEEGGGRRRKGGKHASYHDKRAESALKRAKSEAKGEQQAEKECCKPGNAQCCSAPSYVFSPSALQKLNSMCSVLQQCRTQIPFLAGLRQGCERVSNSEPDKGRKQRRKKGKKKKKGRKTKKGKKTKRRNKGKKRGRGQRVGEIIKNGEKVTSVPMKADPVLKKVLDKKFTMCISKNLRTTAQRSNGRKWQMGLQFQKGSDPCGLMEISTIKAAINRWNVPKDGNTYRSPKDDFRPLANGFYKVREQQNNVSVVLSKKVLVTKHGSTFTKAFVCVKWWQLRQGSKKRRNCRTRKKRYIRKADRKKSKKKKKSKKNSSLQASLGEDRRSRRRKGKVEKSPVMTCKLPAPQLKYDGALYPKITGLAIPVNHAKCLENYLPNVVSKGVREMCLAAHFTTAEQRSKCGSTAFRQYHDLKAKDGKTVPSPLKCKGGKFVCQPTMAFNCASRVCKYKTITTQVEGEAPIVKKKKSCYTRYNPNKCIEDIIPKRIQDAALALCIQESYKRSTKCCTTSKAHLSSGLTAAQRREDEAQFLQF